MYFSILQAPRCKIHTLSSAWWDTLQSFGWGSGKGSGVRLLSCNSYGVETGPARRWSRTVTSETEGRNKTSSSKQSSIRQKILDGSVTTSTKFNASKAEIGQAQNIQHWNVQQTIAEKKVLASLVTIIVFDIETTGFSRVNERIIEIALQDLHGGKNSTFQTLVNPGRHVPNHHVHGITTHMVSRPDVPRMEDLIPILLAYVRSRQKPGGNVVFVAHNGRTFDVPFLINEFSRCSIEIPSDWLFVDTLALARELRKSEGSKAPKLSVKGLREHFGIQLIDSAHRAMSNVHSLSLILQRLTFDLRIPVSGLVERSFSASDLINSKKKS
ncbi:Exonuclease, RNase T/DNA polymerase III [Dillenia turbinata]|uniref:Exonuclease, RNase T/DNA polymerase III n=1 Tax=Dillenia turbinata TaxID=194707 RepID=A0AAN8YSU5_9MAGN